MEVTPGLFNVYWILLTVSGVLMIAVAALPVDKPAARVIEGLLGLGFLGYGLYLGLFFDGYEFVMFFYAFVVPVAVVARAVKEYAASRRVKEAAAHGGFPPPPPYAAPGTAPGRASYAQMPPPSAAPTAPVQQAPYGQPGQPAPYGRPGRD